MKISRLANNPIITPASDPRIGTNINGPSLMRVPEWLPNPLGRYYLYFAHHQGTYIRLAYADDLAGPWRVYTPGSLALPATPCVGHIASPDVHIDERARRLIMYYHGPVADGEQLPWQSIAGHRQCSFVATSHDGLEFTTETTPIGPSYLRAFHYGGWVYALCMPGLFFRSRDGIRDFEMGPRLFDDNMRHAAVMVDGDTLHVFYTSVGDSPEHILHAQIDLSRPWHAWSASPPTSVLMPETEYEGGHLPLTPSQRGAIHVPVRQLRDPAIFRENGETYLLYSVAGEHGIAIASLEMS